MPTKSKPSRQTTQAARNSTVDLLDPAAHSQMHHEHVAWMSDIASWRDDLVEWESETRKVLAEVKQLETMIQQHDLALVAHSEGLLTHRQTMVKHEHSLADFEQDGVGEDLVQASRDHGLERETHLSQQARHEAIKHRHRGLVAHWQELRKKVLELAQL